MRCAAAGGAKRQAPSIVVESGDAGMPCDVEALDAALVRLEVVSPDLARIVELRFFMGLTVVEIAQVLDVSEPTIKRRWKTARLWLADELGAGQGQ